MAVAFDVRPMRTPIRAAAVALAALFVAPALVAPAAAAPARPGAVAAPEPLAQTVAARKGTRAGKAAKVKRGKVVKRRVVRGGRYDPAPAMLGAVAAGVLGAAMAGGYRDFYEDEAPVYVQYPYGGGYGYPRPRARYQGDGYDRRYWRGGAPRHVEPAPGYGPPRGSRWGGGRPAVRPEGPPRGGYGGGLGGGYAGRGAPRGGGWGPMTGSPTPMNPNLPAGAPPMVRDTGGNWMPNTYSGEGSGR